MSRLTKRISVENEDVIFYTKGEYTNTTAGEMRSSDVREVMKKLAEYEELEEQGLLLKLPCKIGSTIYQLINSHIYEYKVIGICFDIFQNKWMCEVAYEIGLEWFKTMCDFDVSGKSKTVFLTKEEAEKALKELESAE